MPNKIKDPLLRAHVERKEKQQLVKQDAEIVVTATANQLKAIEGFLLMRMIPFVMRSKKSA